MNNKFLINIFCLFFLVSCNRPSTRTETLNSGSSGNYGSTTIIYRDGEGQTSSNENINVQTDNGSTTTFGSAATENPDLLNCNWSEDGVNNFIYNHNSIGSYNLCFVESKNQVYVQVQNPKSTGSLCFFPTTHVDNSSTYIGEASCIYMNSNKTIYPIQLYKNRNGYENYTITGLMIMYDIAYSFGYPYYQVLLIPDAYLYCMNYLVYSLYYSQNADTSYCDTFSNAGQYVYHRFN